MISSTIDLSVLRQRVSLLNAALFGKGATEGQLQQLLKTETGQLAGRIGDAVGPATKSKAVSAIDRDMRSQLTFLPASSNFSEEQRESSTADFTWLYASPAVLVGINDEDNQTQVGPEGALQMLRAGQKATPRGNVWLDVGKRGKQHVIRLNRVRVSRATFAKVRAAIMARSGLLRAAFYAVAKKYAPMRRVPGWIGEKIPAAVAAGKSTVAEFGLETSEGAIEFVVTGKGLQSNPRLIAKIQGSVAGSRESMRVKLEKIGRGAKYVFETGQVFFEKFSDN